MKLTDILQEELIIPSMTAGGKRAVMEELCSQLTKAHPELDKDKVLEVLHDRERLGSTGIGEGVAIPHGKMPGITDLLLAMGRSLGGVDFDSLDGQPAHLFFLVLAPENSHSTHLKALGNISRLAKSHLLRQRLMEAADARGMLEIIAENDAEF